MAVVRVGRNQHEEMRRLHPKPAYTRVVSCVASVPAGPGAVYSLTHRLSDNIWLYKVKVWGAPKAVDMSKQTLFRVFTTTKKVSTAAEMLNGQNLLPLTSPGFASEPWTNYDGTAGFEWTMVMFFEGRERYFGFWAERGPLGSDELFASFEISEG